MATQEPAGISGKVGTLIYYVRNGKQCIRAKGPRHIRQTDATRVSAGKFGLASGVAKYIRMALPEHFTPLNDTETRNRLTSSINTWLQSLSTSTFGKYASIDLVRNFEFNKEVPLKKLLKIDFKVEWDNAGKLFVRVPPLNPSKPIPLPTGRSVYPELWISVVSGLLEDTNTFQFDRAEISYASSDKTDQIIEFPVSALPGSLCAVIAGVQYVVGANIGSDNKVKNVDWMSAKILDAVYRAD